MAYIRKVRMASGATAVQIAEYADGRERVVEHVGWRTPPQSLGCGWSVPVSCWSTPLRR